MPTRTSVSDDRRREDLPVPRAQWGRHLRHGFKAAAKRLAAEVRADHGFAEREPFDPARVAARLGHAFVDLAELDGLSDEALRQLTITDPSAFSGVVVRAEVQPVIIINSAHSPERRRSTGTHELSHLLLDHPESPPFAPSGCRDHDARVEAEADFLASVLLVPEGVVMAFARQGVSVAEAAAVMGVSQEMMQWRFNSEGAVKRVKRERAARR